MKRICTSIWQGLGSINLTIVLCSLLTLDLVWGYFCLKYHTSLFTPLNDMGLSAWSQTYGSNNLEQTGWFFLLLVLLSCLSANTFVCTTNRVGQLLAVRRGGWQWLLKLAPHIMHYALIVILGGYLCSYLFTEVLTGRTLVSGSRLSLPGTSGQVGLLAFEPEYYQGKRLAFMDNRVISARFRLLLDDGVTPREAVLGCTQPVRFQGYSLHLRNFAPKGLEGMKMKTRVDLFVRKDPGVGLYLAGMVLFSLGLMLYFFDWIMFREVRKS
ncbi:MAG: hypothetical protein AB7U29_19130 [Desulfobulbus sp.]